MRWNCLEKLTFASLTQAQELRTVTAPCVGSASLVAMWFDSINEQMNFIKAAKPISITRLRVVPIALCFFLLPEFSRSGGEGDITPITVHSGTVSVFWEKA